MACRSRQFFQPGTPCMISVPCAVPRPAKQLLVLMFLFLIGSGVSYSAVADQPNWVPVAELLISSMGESDAVKMSEVMHRCSALNASLAALLGDASPERSQGFQDQSLKMIQNGILIQANLEKERTGIEPDIDVHSGTAVIAVKKMLLSYNTWLDENYIAYGSYFDKDFETEMKGCELASKFVGSLSDK